MLVLPLTDSWRALRRNSAKPLRISPKVTRSKTKALHSVEFLFCALGVIAPPFFATPRWCRTRIAVAMAVSKAGYLLALSNLCGRAHRQLFAGFGRVKDIRQGNLSALLSDIASRCSADLAVTIYREGSLICLVDVFRYLLTTLEVGVWPIARLIDTAMGCG